MPNSWFQFKQFTVQQDRCAMKVSTDACIQGAWAALQLQRQTNNSALHVLDIGTGTGLLSLMLAQLNPIHRFDAIELNGQAFEQAGENFAASPWCNQFSIQHIPLSGFLPAAATRYDRIICNPPFFHNQLGTSDKARNDARHSVSLSKEELACAASILLRNEGLFCVMYPASEWDDWLQISAAYGLFPLQVLAVQPREDLPVNRLIGLFSKGIAMATKETLVIYNPDKSYTSSFRELLQPYYLAL